MSRMYMRNTTGKCPCDANEKIDIIFRNKEKDLGCTAGNYIWEDRNEEYDIVMWRKSLGE